MPKKIILTSNTDWYLYHFRISLANKLREEGFEVVFISPPGKYASMLQEQGYRWRCWKLARKAMTPWTEIFSLINLMKLLRSETADIIHNHTIKPVIYGSIAAMFLGKVRVVNSITGRGYIYLSDRFTVRAVRYIINNIYRLFFNRENFITIFENEADQVYFTNQRILFTGKSTVIPGMGVDTGYFTPAAEPIGTPVILFSGRLLWDKGVGTLVNAARLLKQRSTFRVILVGNVDPGNPSSIPERLIREWVEEGVIEWLGWQEDMSQVYRKCHIVTLPSWGEGIPTSLLEAAASGCPIVATNVPGCRDVVINGKNGWLVEPEDPESLAEALWKLIKDKDMRMKMGMRGRQIVLEKFTTALINTQTLAVYRELLQM
jgi:glycosyltransferase involved in cell wall biosynthesis